MLTHDFISKMDSIMEAKKPHLLVPYIEPSFIESLDTDLDVYKNKYAETYDFLCKNVQRKYTTQLFN